MKQKTLVGVLATLVAAGATFVIAYPNGTDAGVYFGAVEHELEINGKVYTVPDGFSMAFGANGITVTNNTGGGLAAGTKYSATLKVAGIPVKDVKRTVLATQAMIALGAPDVLDADGICASQTPGAAGAMNVNGALKSGNAAVFDVPRCVSVTGAANDAAKVFTITGQDEYGVAMKETITGVNVNTVAGKKAFKKVTSVTISAAAAGAITVGTTDVLGLPIYLSDGDFVLKEMEDGTVRTNGTYVAGDQAKPTATTGDVRGTYKPNSACNGALSFRLLLSTLTPEYLGLKQFA